MNDRRIRSLSGSWLAVALVAGSVVASQAHAANTVQNSNFTTDFSSWSVFLSGTVDADPAGNGSAARTNTQDVDGMNPTAGAALVTLNATPPSDQAKAAAGMHQCVDLGLPAPTVSQANYGARFKVPSTDAIDGSVNIAVEIRSPQDLSFVHQKVPLTVRIKPTGVGSTKTDVILFRDQKEIARRSERECRF